TPGTVTEPNLLEIKSNNYLVSVIAEDEEVGIAYIDITTSEFATTQVPADKTLPELERLNPAELLVASDSCYSSSSLNAPITTLDDSWFELEIAQQVLLKITEEMLKLL
ncbi:DNA mismatch repair protein MutS, partial [Chloroflexota bacterium]